MPEGEKATTTQPVYHGGAFCEQKPDTRSGERGWGKNSIAETTIADLLSQPRLSDLTANPPSMIFKQLGIAGVAAAYPPTCDAKHLLNIELPLAPADIRKPDRGERPEKVVASKPARSYDLGEATMT
jgi:hypothetical protein